MSRRRWQIIAVAAIVLAMAAIFLVVRSGDNSADDSSNDRIEKQSGTKTASNRRAGSSRRSQGTRSGPKSTVVGEGGQEGTAASGEGRESAATVRKGHDVRDHRTGAGAIDPDLPIRRPPSMTRMKSTTTAQIGMRSRSAAKECAADYPDEVGEGAHLDIRLRVSVVAGVLTVEEIHVATTMIPEDGEVVDCVGDELDGLQIGVADARDVENYPLNFPIEL